MTTTWIRAWDLPQSDAALAELVRVKPAACNVDELPPEDASKALTRGLSGFYRPSAQDICLIREIASSGRSHARTFFNSDRQFVTLASSKPEFPPSPEVRMLTGLPGVGKSELLSAVNRLFSKGNSAHPSPNLPAFPIMPTSLIRVRTGITSGLIYARLAESIGIPPEAAKKWTDSVAYLRLRMYQRGVSLILADEMQFVTGSNAANTLAARLLMLASDFGPPVFFACNYSLGHRLKKRPPEECVRFLSRPLIMLPLSADDPALYGFLDDAAVVMDGALDISARDDAQEIHAMTFGVRRLLMRLLVVGYSTARRRVSTGQGVNVTMDCLRQAYASREFEVERTMARNSITAQLGTCTDRNYTCPVEMPHEHEILLKGQAQQHQEFALNQAISDAERTPAERKAIAKNAKAAGRAAGIQAPKPNVKTKATVPRTAADFLASLRAGDNARL